KGAPVKGNTLPLTWSQLVNILYKERFITRKQLKACGGIEALKIRYEQVRLRMQTLFDARREPLDNKGFVVMYAEHFDVYDLSGSKAKYVWADKVESFASTVKDKEVPGDVVHGEAKEEGDAGMEDDYETSDISKIDEDVQGEDRTMDEEEEFYSAEDVNTAATFEDAEDQEEEISEHHHDEFSDLINDFYDVHPGDQEHPQAQTVEIHLGEDGSLPTGSTITLENKADNSQSPPSRLEASEEKEQVIQGRVVDNHSEGPTIATIEILEAGNISVVTAQPVPLTIGAGSQGLPSQVEDEIMSGHVAQIGGGSEGIPHGTKSRLIDSEPAELTHGISSNLDQQIAVRVLDNEVLRRSSRGITKLALSDMIESIEEAATIATSVSKMEEIDGAQVQEQGTRKREQIHTFLKVLEKGKSLLPAKEGTSKRYNEGVSTMQMRETANIQSSRGQNQRKHRSGKLKSNESTFQVFEDNMEGGIIPPRMSANNTRPLGMDLPKENMDERGELRGDPATEQQLSDLRARTHHTQTAQLVAVPPYTSGPFQSPSTSDSEYASATSRYPHDSHLR
ncbi:MAG: hypothetical protein M1830_001267, partial [Pleopsidium flavum]